MNDSYCIMGCKKALELCYVTLSEIRSMREYKWDKIIEKHRQKYRWLRRLFFIPDPPEWEVRHYIQQKCWYTPDDLFQAHSHAANRIKRLCQLSEDGSIFITTTDLELITEYAHVKKEEV